MTNSAGMTTSKSCLSSQTVVVFLILSLKISVLASKEPETFKVGYYAQSCPCAEDIVRQAVDNVTSSNPGIAAGLIRMHFHDCFVRGCDASVLLDTIPGGPASEKDSIPNKSLRGLEVIDAAKSQLEAVCPGTVSCADIIAFAARDSACKVGNIAYDVPSGRRDGRVSLENEPLENIPAPFFNASTVAGFFTSKGLSLDEMVVLSGAHSIGVGHCFLIAGRLYPTVDPTMDPSFAAYLMTICPPPSNNATGPDPTVPQDSLTPNVLDNKCYTDLVNLRGLFTSDQTLYSTPSTSKSVAFYARNPNAWASKFSAAMIHMGSLDILQYPCGRNQKQLPFRELKVTMSSFAQHHATLALNSCIYT